MYSDYFIKNVIFYKIQFSIQHYNQRFQKKNLNFIVKNVKCETIISAFSKCKLYFIEDLTCADPERLFRRGAVNLFAELGPGWGLFYCNVIKCNELI